ncbi:ferric uptake regulator, Fur family [[Leptolyngbya] sp. PCC 7376]|uniref:Fur family transcriptional regulator n=1 Tax=[Leptolyngbya] sp. PCC 7376 TaxID=111781 RepID=UPI00029EDB94|nr:transcriptional repressor [[Leptolyngbya] sp. PCC 7376]AFY40236.1 ferric uptake regulator, Fur family [[Leptolyngbya] sp. PCC 7376]
MLVPSYDVSALKAELNSKGWRLTPQREKILNTFLNLIQGNHLSAEDLHMRLLEQGEKISLSTVYRSVKLMTRMGILRELELAEGHKHYELNQSQEHHHHLVCVQCNKTVEFEDVSINKHSIEQCQQQGFELIDCQLTITTICPEARLMGWPSALPHDWMCSRVKAQEEIKRKAQEKEKV